jgi:hypothetical protein
MRPFGASSTTIWHKFPIHSPSTALIAPSQKNSLDNQNFTRFMSIVQGLLAAPTPHPPGLDIENERAPAFHFLCHQIELKWHHDAL